MARGRASARFWWRQPRCRVAGGCAVIAAAAALLLLPAPGRAEPGLPDRLELEPAPVGIPPPDALIAEAQQCAARVTRPTYGPSVARLVQELRQAILLRRALATVEGRFWPQESDSRLALPAPASGPAFFREGQLARGRALDVISALAAAHPEQAVRLIDRLASALSGEDDWLASTAAYGAALAAAPADAERAGQLAAAVRDETRRGLAWEQVGRAYLQKGDWPRALAALQAATGVGRVSLLGAMARRASPEQLRQLQLLPGSVEERLALVEALAASQPDQAWEVARKLKADSRFFGAAASVAAALANRDPARALDVLDEGLASASADSVVLPGADALATAFARVDAGRALAVATRLRDAGGPEGGTSGEESLGRLAAGVAAVESPRAAAMLSLLRDPDQRRLWWEAAGGNAVIRSPAEVERLASLAPDGESRSCCLAGAARQHALKDPAGGFTLALEIPDAVVRAQALSEFSAGQPGPTPAALSDACGAAAKALMADYRQAGAPAALGAVLRRLAALDPKAVQALLDGAPDAEPWRDLFANQIGPVDPELAERLSPEVGRYWTLQATLRQAQAAAARDPRDAIRQIEGAPQPAAAGVDPLYRSHQLAAAGIALALRDPQAALGLDGQIGDVEERSHYLVALGERLPLSAFDALIASARALPDDEWRARALAGLALALEGHEETVARSEAGARATDPAVAAGEYRAAVFCAPLLAETQFNLARALDRAGWRAESRAAYARFLDLRPGSPLAAALAGR